MNCRKVRSLIALAVGGDLNAKDQRRLEAHLATCKNCQQQYAELQESIDLAKTLFRKDTGLNWDESEWEQLLGHVIAEDKKTRQALSVKYPRLAWAISAGFLILLAVGAGYLFLGRMPHSPKKTAEISIPSAQSVSALVFASQETGLTIHWYVNKEFKYEEETK